MLLTCTRAVAPRALRRGAWRVGAQLRLKGSEPPPEEKGEEGDGATARQKLQDRWEGHKERRQERREERKEEIQESKETLAGMTLYQKLKHYGPVAMAIYLCIHTVGFWIMFGLIYAGVPVKKYLADWMGGEEHIPAWGKGPWAEFAIALTVNKMFGPLQMLTSISITPRVAPVILSWGPTRWAVNFISRFFPKKPVAPPKA